MSTSTILEEINKLPLSEKLLVIEEVAKEIRQHQQNSLQKAAEALYIDYKTDKELTIFTQLDGEPFYETK